MRVRIDDTRHDDHAARIAALGIAGDGHIGADRDDLAALDNQRRIVERRAGHGVDGRVLERHGALLCFSCASPKRQD